MNLGAQELQTFRDTDIIPPMEADRNLGARVLQHLGAHALFLQCRWTITTKMESNKHVIRYFFAFSPVFAHSSLGFVTVVYT